MAAEGAREVSGEGTREAQAREARVRGISIRYELRGPADGELVALLNGIAMSIAHWKPVADALVDAGYRVLSHDLRGQLLSDKAGAPYSFEGHAADLAELLGAIGAREARLVGTSYGAETALRFAGDFPERTKSLVLIGAAASYDAVLGAAIAGWKAAALSDPVVFYRSILPWNYSASWLAGNVDVVAKREAALASLPRSYFEAFAALCDAFLALDFVAGMSRIRAPALVMVGDMDILKPPRYAREIVRALPNASYAEIPGAGHAAVVERPGEIAEAAIAFMRSH
ncbi:MAG: alpha/beta hydrolase [Spirochaetaceae bacterium]|nr:alpha/beta hydrolase [Spirochaetaceae bacterium]